MPSINPRFAALTLLTAIMMGCSTLGSIAGASHDSYGPLENRSIPGNSLHVYQLAGPTTNMGRTTSMAIRAENARIEKVSDLFALAGIALAFVPSFGATLGSPLFLFCAASLTTNERSDWWTSTSLQPGSLMAGVADRRYCFTENGRIRQ